MRSAMRGVKRANRQARARCELDERANLWITWRTSRAYLRALAPVAGESPQRIASPLEPNRSVKSSKMRHRPPVKLFDLTVLVLDDAEGVGPEGEERNGGGERCPVARGSH